MASSTTKDTYNISVIGKDGKRKKAPHIYAEEDVTLFGDRNAQIHQYMSDRIEVALVEGVASLPLMGGTEDDSRDDKMLQKLRKAYLDKIDIMEVHNSRNVFTVGKHTPHFRKRILEAFLAHQEGRDILQEKAKEIQSKYQTNNDSNSKSISESLLPAKEEIATPEDVANLEEELKGLRMKLEEARKVRSEKLAQCKALEEAAQFSKQAQETIAKIPAATKIPAKVDSLVEARTEYASLKTQGNRLIQKMDDIKNGRDENQDKIPSPEHKKIRTKLTLEEEYEQHRRILGESQPQDLFALRDLLKSTKP